MTIHISAYFIAYWIICAALMPISFWFTLKIKTKDPLVVSMIKPIIKKNVLTMFGISLLLIADVMLSPFLFPVSILSQIKSLFSKPTKM